MAGTETVLIPPAAPSAAVRMAAQLSEEPSSPQAQHSRPFLPGHYPVMDPDTRLLPAPLFAVVRQVGGNAWVEKNARR